MLPSVSVKDRRSWLSGTSSTTAAASRQSTRASRLASSLSRSFITAQPLSQRNHTQISDIVGPMAPERYASLPPRSEAAAKALLAVAVCKDLRDAQRIEEMRRKRLDSSEAVEDPDCWFDAVSAALLERRLVGGAKDVYESLKGLKMPLNGSNVVPRLSQLPLEAFRIDAVMGRDYTHSVAPRSDDSDSHVDRVNNRPAPAQPAAATPKTVSANADSVFENGLVTHRPVDEETIATPDTAQAAMVQSAVRQASNSLPTPSAPEDVEVPLDLDGDGVDQLPMDMDIVAPILNHQKRPIADPSAISRQPETASNLPEANLQTPSQAPQSNNVGSADERVQLPVSLVFNEAAKKVSIDFNVVPVDAAGAQKSVPKSQADMTPDAAVQSVKAIPTNSISIDEVTPSDPEIAIVTPLKSKPFNFDVTGEEEVCKLREGAPTTHLQSLLSGLNDDENEVTPVPIPEPVAPAPDVEVVIVEGDETPTPKPKRPVRRTKRRTSQASKADEAAGTERRASRMRSAVVSALQENSEVRKRVGRSAQNNGRARSQAKQSGGTPKTPARSSRRVRRSVSAPIVDSSSSDSGNPKPSDEDFTLESEDDGVLEILPQPRATEDKQRREAATNPPSSQRSRKETAPAATPPQRMSRLRQASRNSVQEVAAGGNGIDMTNSPSAAPGMVVDKVIAGNGITPSSRPASGSKARKSRDGGSMGRSGRTTRANNAGRANEAGHATGVEARASGSGNIGSGHTFVGLEDSNGGVEKGPVLWDRDIRRVEAMLNCHDTGSPELSSSEEEANLAPFGERIPILRRLLKPVHEGRRCIFEIDQFDEHEEMMQFYKETQNDPPYRPDSKSPGTQFMLECWEKTKAGRYGRGDDIGWSTEENLGGGVFTGGNTTVTIAGDSDAERMSSGSKGSKESSDGSSERSERSESSEEEGYEESFQGGSKRSRSHARSRASKARELQWRVCGELLATMVSEAKRRVLRWAERDFTWFDAGTDVMEIVASRASKPCSKCDVAGEEGENCEESILLKLWKDMSWRKVRRMRHRRTGN